MSTGEYVTTVALIALAMTAIVPLALRRPPSLLDTLSAALAVASFAGPPSLAAAALAVPWIATTGVHVARTRTLPGLWVLAAGGWLAMHRGGVDPLAVGDQHLEAAAGHLHRVDADVHQHLDPGGGLESVSVTGLHRHGHRAIDGCHDRAV